jgi:hypothetical protein
LLLHIIHWLASRHEHQRLEIERRLDGQVLAAVRDDSREEVPEEVRERLLGVGRQWVSNNLARGESAEFPEEILYRASTGVIIYEGLVESLNANSALVGNHFLVGFIPGVDEPRGVVQEESVREQWPASLLR